MSKKSQENVLNRSKQGVNVKRPVVVGYGKQVSPEVLVPDCLPSIGQLFSLFCHEYKTNMTLTIISLFLFPDQKVKEQCPQQNSIKNYYNVS